jgi:hypothetical protein
MRLWRPYSSAREVSNFSAELRGDEFKAVLHVLKSRYATLSNNKNSLILCAAFLQGMQGSDYLAYLRLLRVVPPVSHGPTACLCGRQQSAVDSTGHSHD